MAGTAAAPLGFRTANPFWEGEPLHPLVRLGAATQDSKGGAGSRLGEIGAASQDSKGGAGSRLGEKVFSSGARPLERRADADAGGGWFPRPLPRSPPRAGTGEGETEWAGAEGAAHGDGDRVARPLGVGG